MSLVFREILQALLGLGDSLVVREQVLFLVASGWVYLSVILVFMVLREE